MAFTYLPQIITYIIENKNKTELLNNFINSVNREINKHSLKLALFEISKADEESSDGEFSETIIIMDESLDDVPKNSMDNVSQPSQESPPDSKRMKFNAIETRNLLDKSLEDMSKHSTDNNSQPSQGSQLDSKQIKFKTIEPTNRQPLTIEVNNGEWAEEEMRNILSKIPDISILDSSKINHSGDFIITMKNKTIMIEVKNYKQMVPQSEINKLFSDMETKDITYGMFFSINSRITGKEMLEIEVRNNKHVLFVSYFNMIPEVVNFSLYWHSKYIEIVEENNKYSNKDDEEESILKEHFNECKNALENINTLKTKIECNKQQFDNFNNYLIQFVNQIESNIRKLLSSYNKIDTDWKIYLSKKYKKETNSYIPIKEIHSDLLKNGFKLTLTNLETFYKLTGHHIGSHKRIKCVCDLKFA